jgi:hypothetical protein
MRSSHRTLKILAALTWITGGVVLLLKGGSLAIEAWELQSHGIFNYFPLLTGIPIGGIKARYLFSRSCRKNLKRIASLQDPKIWQFFRPGFFLFLISMVVLGTWLSRISHGRYVMLIGVSTLDLTISVALLGSLYAFLGKNR